MFVFQHHTDGEYLHIILSMIKQSVENIGTDQTLMHFLEAMICYLNLLKSCSFGVTLNTERCYATGLSYTKSYMLSCESCA